MSAFIDLSNPRNPFPWIPDTQLARAPAGVLFPEYYEFLMGWRIPVAAIATYILVVELANSQVKEEKLSRVVSGGKAKAKSNSSPAFTAFIFLHNAALCLYSGWTFYNSFTTYKATFAPEGAFWNAWCDYSHTYWNKALNLYAYYFYLSKYYEIVDTIIILLKGRKSSLLQTYHHSGAILSMWAAVNYRAHPIWIFVIFNSFIHTIMYFYYAATTVGLNPPFKQNLTQLQITQFLTGQVLGTYYLFGTESNCIPDTGARLAIWLVILYSLPLVWLFVQFARRIYGGVNKAAAAKKGAKKE